MKLELKHLAPYLPYGLKGLVTDKIHKGWLPEGSKLELSIRHFNSFDGIKIKPILRPLSDCYEYQHLEDDLKEFVGFGGWSDSNDEFLNHLYEYSYDYNTMSKCPYEVFNFFVSNNFDVFGLIEKGLAIDINTINK